MNYQITDLEDLIVKKEAQLAIAESECNAWNTGKYKSSSNAQMSKIFVNSLKKEITDLYKKLEQAKSEGA